MAICSSLWQQRRWGPEAVDANCFGRLPYSRRAFLAADRDLPGSDRHLRAGGPGGGAGLGSGILGGGSTVCRSAGRRERKLGHPPDIHAPDLCTLVGVELIGVPQLRGRAERHGSVQQRDPGKPGSGHGDCHRDRNDGDDDLGANAAADRFRRRSRGRAGPSPGRGRSRPAQAGRSPAVAASLAHTPVTARLAGDGAPGSTAEHPRRRARERCLRRASCARGLIGQPAAGDRSRSARLRRS